MSHRRTSSSLTENDTGFPEQFIGSKFSPSHSWKTASWRPLGLQLISLLATRRHPEALVLSTPWEPKQVDLVSRARKLSMLHHQAMQAMALSLNENDYGLEHGCYVSGVPSRKGSTFGESRNSANILAPADLTTPVYPGAFRCSSVSGNTNPSGSSFSTRGHDSISQAIPSGTGTKCVTDALGLGRSHSRGSTTNGYVIGRTRGHSHDSANTESSMGHGYTYGNSPPHSPSTSERLGLSAWAAKFGGWKAEKKKKEYRKKQEE